MFSSGTVYGRTRINVRVCSCPKRDKEKEENDLKKGTENRPSKKRKLEKNGKKPMLPNSSNTTDNKEYMISVSLFYFIFLIQFATVILF